MTESPRPTLSVRTLDAALQLPAWIARSPRTHLRTGSSICSHLLPTTGDLAGHVERATEAGLQVELATPPVRDLSPVSDLLTLLADQAPRAEVVANDWGVLRLLLREHPSLRPVAGRLLVHAMADPRLASLSPRRFGTQDWPRAWRQGAAASPAWCSLMDEFDVQRIEVDWGPCGTDRAAWGDTGMALTLHLPLALVAAGRFCAHTAPRGPVDRTTGSCLRPCLDSTPEVHVRGDHGEVVPVLSLGTAEAVRVVGQQLRRVERWLSSPRGPDRIALRNGGW